MQQLHREYREMGEVTVLKMAGRLKSIPLDQESTFYALEARERDRIEYCFATKSIKILPEDGNADKPKKPEKTR